MCIEEIEWVNLASQLTKELKCSTQKTWKLLLGKKHFVLLFFVNEFFLWVFFVIENWDETPNRYVRYMLFSIKCKSSIHNPSSHFALFLEWMYNAYKSRFGYMCTVSVYFAMLFYVLFPLNYKMKKESL
jgi:hypothetical protein